MASFPSWVILRVRGHDARKTTGSACSLDAAVAAAGSEGWVRLMGTGQTTEPCGPGCRGRAQPREGRACSGRQVSECTEHENFPLQTWSPAGVYFSYLALNPQHPGWLLTGLRPAVGHSRGCAERMQEAPSTCSLPQRAIPNPHLKASCWG